MLKPALQRGECSSFQECSCHWLDQCRHACEIAHGGTDRWRQEEIRAVRTNNSLASVTPRACGGDARRDEHGVPPQRSCGSDTTALDRRVQSETDWRAGHV